MLGDDYLKKRRKHNNALCGALLMVNTMDLKAAYPIGITGSDGKMKVQITSTHQDKKLPLAGTGDTLFLLKCRLPSSTIEDDENLHKLIGGRRRCLTQYVKLHLYFLVEEKSVDDFMLRASLNFSQSITAFTDLGDYGRFIIDSVRGGLYDDEFDEEKDLTNVSGLDASFMSEEEFQNYIKTQSSADKLESGIITSSDSTAIAVMTQLMDLSITGIESGMFPHDIS